MFDEVRCKHPLPRAQDEAFQTKDLARLVHREAVGEFLDRYEVTEDGHLHAEKHEREWVKDAEALLGG